MLIFLEELNIKQTQAFVKLSTGFFIIICYTLFQTRRSPCSEMSFQPQPDMQEDTSGKDYRVPSVLHRSIGKEIAP
jgi:hypothetical protein